MPQLEDLSTPTASLQLVFVYGTLRRGEQRDINCLFPAPIWVGRGCVTGTLYDLGDYPGLVLDACGATGGEVMGEVYWVTAELAHLLDEIEEVWPQNSGEYTRKHVTVAMDNSLPGGKQRLVCLMYEVNPTRTHGKTVIASGNWVRYRLCLPSV